MQEYIRLDNGVLSGIRIAEIKEIPYYKLINEADLDRANYDIHQLFVDILHNFHSANKDMRASIELLFLSEEVKNQTYKAQVRIFLVLRGISGDIDSLKINLDTYESFFKNELQNRFYDVDFIHDQEGLTGFDSALRNINTDSVFSISKKEDAQLYPLFQEGYLYYVEVPQPSGCFNTSAITNMMSQHPGSAVMLQIIPTEYTAIEKTVISQMNQQLSFQASQMISRMQRPEPMFQKIQACYQMYQSTITSDLFLYNFVVFGATSATDYLAGSVINSLEKTQDTLTVQSYEKVALKFTPKFWEQYQCLPWFLSGMLTNEIRNRSIWEIQYPPINFKRFKQLILINELTPLFKIPINDDQTIGIRTRRTQFSRVQLGSKIINDTNFKLGRVENASRGEENTNAGVPINQFAKHGLIVGMPGSGKTFFALGMLLQFWRRFKIPFLTIEPTKTEYRSLIDLIPEIRIFTPGKNSVSPFLVNPFIPPKGVTVETYAPSVATAFKAAFSMPNPLPDLFLKAVNDCYALYNWKKDSTVDDPAVKPFGMNEFIKVFKSNIEHSNYKGESKANIESAGVVRLVSMIEQNSNIYDTIHSVPIDELLEKPAVLELNAIADKQQKALIMAIILIQFCAYTKNNIAKDAKLKNILLIDEAHVLLDGGGQSGDPESAGAQATTVETMEDMIKEIRAYGMGIIIADQSPVSIGKEIVANTDVKIIFRLTEEENKKLIKGVTGMTDLDYESLVNLGVGEAYFDSGVFEGLLRIQTYNINDSGDRSLLTDEELSTIEKIRDNIPDSDLEGKIGYWADHYDKLIPHIECKYNCKCTDTCDMKVRTNADFIASKLITLRLHELADKNALLTYLGTRINRDILELSREDERITYDCKFVTCVKIKFLRKAMISVNYGISEPQYKKILEHPNFLKRYIPDKPKEGGEN